MFAQQQNCLTAHFSKCIPVIKRCVTVFCICQLLEKKWQYSEAVHQLFVYFKKAIDSVRREALCNISYWVWCPYETNKVDKKKCLTETYSRVWLVRHLTRFLLRTVSNKGIAFQLGFRICHLEGSSKPGGLEIKLYLSASGLCWWCKYIGWKHTYCEKKHRSFCSH